MSKSVQLYDFSRRENPNKCWSFNVWKIRQALNYKKIPYTTQWVDHNTLKPTLSSLGVPPDTTGQNFEYHLPTVRLPDGSMMTESAIIAAKLEGLFPSPSLRLNEELEAEANKAVHAAAGPLFAIYMPSAARDVIPLDAVQTFITSREQRFGVKFDEWEASRGGEVAWNAAEPGFEALKRLLASHKLDNGPFILGQNVCYADFLVTAMFETVKRVDPDIFSRVMTKDDSFVTLYEASNEWLQNDQ